MIRKIVDRILPDIEALVFADVVAGIATTITKKTPNKENTGSVVQKFPAYIMSQDSCGSDVYLTLYPDSQKMSVIYFEDLAATVLNETYDYIEFAHRVRLIYWLNLSKIDEDLVDGAELSAAIMAVMPKKILPFDYMNRIFIEFSGIEQRSEAIFNRYTYDETQKQYLMYPFDYGGLNYTIKYALYRECVNDLILNPAICQK